jgi:acetylornithine/N-succinyldiaminopimelate aminotransferase
MPHVSFVPYNDINALSAAMDSTCAAVILEPIQGEGGIIVPDDDYLEKVSLLCKKNGTLLIADEIQTGFYRTGSLFMSTEKGIPVDFVTMGKGIAGGFPFGAVAVSNDVASHIEVGDHGGTYNGNPLGCAVATAVIEYLVTMEVGARVSELGNYVLGILQQWQAEMPEIIKDVRGKGFLLAMELHDSENAKLVFERSLELGLMLNLKHGTIIRISPALTICKEDINQGLRILRKALADIVVLKQNPIVPNCKQEAQTVCR